MILLDSGRVLLDGRPQEVCNRFYEMADQEIAERAREHSAGRRYETGGAIHLLDMQLLNGHRIPTNIVHQGETVEALVRYQVVKPVESPIFGVGIHTTDFIS